MQKNILVTGGAGYIGSTVVNYLIDRGYSVTVVDNLKTGNKLLVNKKASFYICDISEKKKISNILNSKKFDAVMHFAAFIRVDESVSKPKKYLINNFTKSKIFFETCFKNKLYNVILSSTASVYGNQGKEKKSERSRLNPINPYAKSKLMLEKFLIDKSKKIPIKYIILRYFNVAGAEKKLRTGLISKFSTHLIKIACEVATNKKKKLIINGDDYKTKDGTTVRDYIHVSDLAELHYLSFKDLLKKKKSKIFNCGYGLGYSVQDVIKSLNKILKKPINTKIGPRRAKDSVYLVANTNKLLNYFFWKPKYNNLSLIIKSSLEWEKKLSYKS